MAGQRSTQGDARSRRRAISSTNASPPKGATICTPIGRPSGCGIPGTLIEANPAAFTQPQNIPCVAGVSPGGASSSALQAGADGDDRLAQGDDDHQPEALGEVGGRDGEAAHVADVGRAVVEREREDPDRRAQGLVVDVGDDTFSVSLIPTTLELTTLGTKDVGDPVNLEVDVLAKYVERLLAARLAPKEATA